MELARFVSVSSSSVINNLELPTGTLIYLQDSGNMAVMTESGYELIYTTMDDSFDEWIPMSLFYSRYLLNNYNKYDRYKK